MNKFSIVCIIASEWESIPVGQ